MADPIRRTDDRIGISPQRHEHALGAAQINDNRSIRMAWFALLLAGFLEIIWALGLKYSAGFTRFWPSLATCVAIALSFGLLSLSSFAAYLWNGFFTNEIFMLALIIGPAYAVSLFFGGRFFGRTEGANYRPVVYALIALAALSSMPVFDHWLR